MTMLHFVMYWALTGIFVPVVIIIVGQLQGGVFEWPYLAVALWPSWIIMGATYGREVSTFGLLVLVISIVINMALYSVVGAVFWLLFGRFLK
jgi:hypothetical protein